MWAPEVKGKIEKCAQNRDILSDIFFEFPAGRKWVFGIGDFGVAGAVRNPKCCVVLRDMLGAISIVTSLFISFLSVQSRVPASKLAGATAAASCTHSEASLRTQRLCRAGKRLARAIDPPPVFSPVN
jgi:hypothetical protein